MSDCHILFESVENNRVDLTNGMWWNVVGTVNDDSSNRRIDFCSYLITKSDWEVGQCWSIE